MRTRDLFFTAMTAMFLVGIATAQQPIKPLKPPEPVKPAPAADSLEGQIADAMKHNSDIQAAAAKVREAEIQLTRIRSEVMVHISAQREVVQNAKEMLKALEQMHQQREKLRQTGAFSMSEVTQSQIELFRVRSEVAKLDAEMIKLIGRVAGKGQAAANVNFTSPYAELTFSPDGRLFAARSSTGRVDVYNTSRPRLFLDGLNGLWLWDHYGGLATDNPNLQTTAAGTSIPNKLRDAMAKPIKFEKEIKNVPVADVLEMLKQRGLSDVPLRVMLASTKGQTTQTPVDLMAGELPLSAWLVAVQDSVPELRFVVRDYGLLVTTVDRAPPDGILLADFLRRPVAKPEAKKEEKPKP